LSPPKGQCPAAYIGTLRHDWKRCRTVSQTSCRGAAAPVSGGSKRPVNGALRQCLQYFVGQTTRVGGSITFSPRRRCPARPQAARESDGPRTDRGAAAWAAVADGAAEALA